MRQKAPGYGIRNFDLYLGPYGIQVEGMEQQADYSGQGLSAYLGRAGHDLRAQLPFSKKWGLITGFTYRQLTGKSYMEDGTYKNSLQSLDCELGLFYADLKPPRPDRSEIEHLLLAWKERYSESPPSTSYSKQLSWTPNRPCR